MPVTRAKKVWIRTCKLKKRSEVLHSLFQDDMLTAAENRLDMFERQLALNSQ